MGVNFNPDGWSGSAHVALTPMPRVSNAIASVHATVTKALATEVRLNIVIVPSAEKCKGL